jgi:hypothetical protein
MTTASVDHVAAVTAITGNQITATCNTQSGVATSLALSNIKMTLSAEGDVHGMLLFPFADPETLEGMLLPAELQNAQIELTEAGAGAAVEVIAEELWMN